MMKLLGVAFLVLFCSVATAPAPTLNWSAVSWPAGSLSNSYDIDPSNPGNDITVAISGNTSTLQSGSPNTTSSQIGGTGKSSLQTDVVFPNSTTTGLTFTITFDYPAGVGVYVRNLNILDVDANLVEGGWQDKISGIQGLTATGQTVNPVAVAGGGSAVSVTGNSSTGFTAIGQTSTVDSSTSNISVDFGNFRIKQIVFIYSPGPGQPADPSDQLIGLDNITFSLTPEVGPSLAAITLCGLVMLARMWQEQKKKKRLEATA